MSDKKKQQFTLSIFIVIFIYIIMAAIMYKPVLNNRYLLFGTDTITHDYIMEYYGWSQVIKTGSMPLWMPYIFGGIPFISTFSFCPFYPVKFLSCFLKFPFAFNFQYYITAVIGGLLFYFYLRAFGRTKASALFGGMAFMLGGHFVTLAYPGHLAKFQAITGIPLAIGALRLALDRQRFLYYLLCGSGFALSFLGSHFQIAFYSILLCGIYLFFHLWTTRKCITCGKFYQSLMLFTIAVIFGITLSGAQSLPGLEFSKYSNRSDTVDYESATMGSFPPFETFEYIFPRFTGDSIQDAGVNFYWGEWGERLVSDYIGMSVFILCIFGLFMSKDKSKYFFLASLIISLLLCYGKYSPVWRFAYYYLPVFSKFRSPATIMVIPALSFISIAAMGFDEIFQRRKKAETKDTVNDETNNDDQNIEETQTDKNKNYVLYRLTGDFKYLLFAMFFFLLSIGYFLLYQKFGSLLKPLHLRIFYENILTKEEHLYITVAGSLIIGSIVFLILYLYTLTSKSKIAAGFFLTLFIIFSFGDLYINNRIFIKPIDAENYHQYLFNSFPGAILNNFPPPIRIIEKNNELTNKFIFQRVGSTHGYHPVAFKRYFDLLGEFGFYDPTFLQLTNCRFVITDNPGEYGQDYKILAPFGGKFLADYGDEYKYAYFPEKIILVNSDEDAIEFLKTKFDGLDNIACFQSDTETSETLGKYTRKAPAGEYSCSIMKYSDNKVELRIKAPAEAWCVVSEYNVPGWKIIDENDKLIPAITANYFYRAFKVPRGESLLRMVYFPTSLKYGIAFSIISVCILLMSVIVHIILNRKNKKSSQVENNE